MDILPLIQQVGFPIALCVVLIYAIKAQNAQLVKAFTDRIKTLETVVEEQGERIIKLEADRLRRADDYAQTLKDIAGRYAKVVTDHDAWSKQAFALLSRLIDVWQERPCMADRYDPHDHRPQTIRTPSSSEIPAPPRNPVDPSKADTEVHREHG